MVAAYVITHGSIRQFEEALSKIGTESAFDQVKVDESLRLTGCAFFRTGRPQPQVVRSVCDGVLQLSLQERSLRHAAECTTVHAGLCQSRSDAVEAR